MKKIYTKQLATLFISCSMFITPITTFANTLEVGSRGSKVALVQSTLKELGYFNYPEITAYYGYITAEAVKEFQEAKGLEATGIAGTETIKALKIVAPIKSESENKEYSIGGALDWFSEVQYIFPREGNATVTDVVTGKSFELKRTFGTNHADVEPLTQKDAEIIKSIWGSWSWERRAVIVNSNDTLIAGSMTAFPHAGVENAPAIKVVDNRSGNYGRGQNLDSVKGNSVDGHMDIHFLNSRTHGTNVVQKEHQNKVKEASEYIDKNY